MPADVPVLLIAFRRPACTSKVMQRLSRVAPSVFRVAMDYENSDKHRAARKIACTKAWDCDLAVRVAASRMGLKRRMVSAIDWVLNDFDRVIVIEDDCVLHPSFFRFCSELLDRYADDERVMHIGALNTLYGTGTNTSDSYYFSQRFHCWGWATWRRAWQHNDSDISDWDKVLESDLLQRTASHPRLAAHRRKNLSMVKAGKLNSWAFPWGLSCLRRGGLSIIPRVSAVHNIGFGAGSTHSRRRPPFARKALGISFPLKHPKRVEKDAALERASCRFL